MSSLVYNCCFELLCIFSYGLCVMIIYKGLTGEQPVTEFHYTSPSGDVEVSGWYIRTNDMQVQEELRLAEEAFRLAEERTTQHHDAKMHINDQERRPPEQKDLNTRPRDITRLTHIQHPPEPPTTVYHDENMQNNHQKQQALPKLNALNTRPINMEGLNEKHHLEGEQPTTQDTVTNTHNEDQEQGHREVKVWNARPRNMKRLKEIHHIGEQPTTLLHNTNVHRLINENHDLKKEQEDIHKKIEEQFKQIRVVEAQKEEETVQWLQCEGQLCDLNCVSLAILWICKHKLESMNFFCCAPQFVTLVTLHAFLEEKLSHMPRCGYFMNTLQNVEIVRKVYECEMNGELEINEAWETLMKMNERVCILAKWSTQGVGHVVVFDLDTRTSKTKDGKVMFHDRQALPSSGRRRVEMTLQKFIEYVNNVSLMLYTVDLEGFNRIMVYYKDVLHITELPHSCARIG